MFYLLILLIVSSLPVFLICMYIYRKDKEKEPTNLLVKLFLGGIGSAGLALILENILTIIAPDFFADTSKLNLIELVFSVLIGIALIEEVCKWIFVYKLVYNDKEFDELYDAILYCTFVSLGFAWIENVSYVMGYGIETGISRVFFAIPGHACLGIIMGYFLGKAKVSEVNNELDLRKKNLILSVVIPTILHGIYDYCLLSGSNMFVLLFYLFVMCFFAYAFNKAEKISLMGTKIKTKSIYCPNCGNKINGNFCSKCGRRND